MKGRRKKKRNSESKKHGVKILGSRKVAGKGQRIWGARKKV